MTRRSTGRSAGLPGLALLSLALPLHAAGPSDGAPLIPRKALFADTVRRAVTLAPDGERVAWIEDTAAGPRLHVAAVDAPQAPEVAAVADVATFRFTDDGRLLVVASAPAGEAAPTANGGPGDVAGDRLLLLGAPSAEPADLTPVAGARLQLTVAQPHLRDALLLVALAGVQADSGVYRVELPPAAAGATDAPPAVTRVADLDGALRFWADEALALRAAWRTTPSGQSALLRRAGDGEWIEHARYGWESARVSGVVSLTADGRTLHVVDDAGLDKAALKAIDVATGEETILATDPLADLLWGGATVTADGQVQAVVAYFARLRRHVLDPALARDFELLRFALPGETSFGGRSADDRRWLVRSMKGGPLESFVYDRDAGRVTRLFSELPALDGALLAPRHAAAVPARDGLLLACHLYLPPGSDADGDGRPEQPLPTVLYVHGGPWVGFEWNSWFHNRSFQLLANRGYAVVRTDFRGAGGYGKAFMDAGDRQWSGAMRTDLLDIADWAVQQGIADRQRLAMWGWSYGGYTTASALAYTPGVFACGLAMYGVYDLLAFTEWVDQRWGPGAELWRRRVGDPRDPAGRQQLWHDSPQRLVADITAPLLVTHGGLDERVPPSQSERFVAALRQAGKDVRYLVYPDEPHDYRKPVSWESFWAEGEAFLQRHLGGRAEPPADEHERAGVVIG